MICIRIGEQKGTSRTQRPLSSLLRLLYPDLIPLITGIHSKRCHSDWRWSPIYWAECSRQRGSLLIYIRIGEPIGASRAQRPWSSPQRLLHPDLIPLVSGIRSRRRPYDWRWSLMCWTECSRQRHRLLTKGRTPESLIGVPGNHSTCPNAWPLQSRPGWA